MAHEPPHALRCLKPDGVRSVWLVQRPDQDPRTLKTWPFTALLAIKLLLGIGQPQRQVRGARRLRRAGVPTPNVIGSWRFARRSGRPVIELELEHASGLPALELLRRIDKKDRAGVRRAELIGRSVASIASAGLLHRDLKLSNIIVGSSGEDPCIWLIDPVGVRRMNDRPTAFVRMFDRLLIEPISEGTDIPDRLWRRTLHSALMDETKIIRRAVFRRLRAHLQP